MWLTNTKEDWNMALLKRISEHFNGEAVRNLCKWKIVDFDGISYGDVSEIIQ